MGMFDNARKVDVESLADNYKHILGEGETIEHAYSLIRDKFLFTSRRLIICNTQGVTGKKIEYLSIPYKSIVRFAVETAGTFDLDAELKIWTSGESGAISKEFNKKVDIYEVQSLLAKYVCG